MKNIEKILLSLSLISIVGFLSSCKKETETVDDPKNETQLYTNWEQLQEFDYSSEKTFSNVCQTSSNVAWMYESTEKALYHTVDGWKTFSKNQNFIFDQSLVAEYKKQVFRDMSFVNDNIGFILLSGDNNITILKTTDGGVKWDSAVANIAHAYLNDIHFSDANNGWIVGLYNTAYKTSNGGKTWTKITFTDDIMYDFTDADFNAVYFSDANTGWISAWLHNKGYVIKTTDGGQTWHMTAFDQTDLNKQKVIKFRLNGSRGTAVATDGMLSHDGGETWQRQWIGNTFLLCDMQFVSDKIGFAIGGADGGFAYTTDGGKNELGESTWTKIDKKYFGLTKENDGIACWGMQFYGDTLGYLYTTVNVLDGYTHNRIYKYRKP